MLLGALRICSWMFRPIAYAHREAITVRVPVLQFLSPSPGIEPGTPVPILSMQYK